MSSTSNSSLVRSRSLRSTSLKPASTVNPQSNGPASGPSNISLFLTNLRLLGLDLRDDWPGITAVTFSTSTRQENQKKRIQCVEWALYNLFALLDAEETRNKLQPFFPPLEQLQSLNLRAALFRYLDQAKKNGILGRDVVLRKTMLDDCKGDRLEEVLAVFSNSVLKKVLQEGKLERHQAIAQQLAYKNFSYTGERTVLSALIIAHKGSLGTHLRAKEDLRARYRDFSNLLDLNDRRIVRRHEQLKEAIDERYTLQKLSNREVGALRNQAQRNWTGSDEWLETILDGDGRFSQDGFLATPFDRVWRHVKNSTIGDVEGKQSTGLLEQLDARIRDQENRLARWQDFGKTLSKTDSSCSSKTLDPESKHSKVDLGFNRHVNLQINQSNSKSTRNISTVPLDEYTRLMENMRNELADVGKLQARDTRTARHSSCPERPLPALSSPSKPESPSGKDEEWSSASDTDAHSPRFNNYATESTSPTPPYDDALTDTHDEEVARELPSKVRAKESMAQPKIATRPRKDVEAKPSKNTTASRQDYSPSSRRLIRTPSPTHILEPRNFESDLADEILDSMSAASPSPKKLRHTLSLAERTRLSMSRASHSQYSDLHDDCDNLADLPQLAIRPKPSHRASSSVSSEDDKHAGLIERTRKSMAGFEAAQKKVQMERRRSVKDAKKKQRESSYFPRLEEEAEVANGLGVNKQELIEGDPDYESVFMSRPKIKTSPAVSPTKTWGDGDEPRY